MRLWTPAGEGFRRLGIVAGVAALAVFVWFWLSDIASDGVPIGDWIGLIIGGGIAFVGVYLVVQLIGWTIAGFTRASQ